MMFFRALLVILLIAYGNGTFTSEDANFQLPKALQQFDEILRLHLFAFVECNRTVGFSEGNRTIDGFITYQIDNSTTGCFWECVLTNIGMMKNGHLEYVAPEEKGLLKDIFDACSKKKIMKVLEGCPLAHMFLMCEYNTFIEKATMDLHFLNQEIAVFVRNFKLLLKDINTKLDMIMKTILKDSFYIYTEFF